MEGGEGFSRDASAQSLQLLDLRLQVPARDLLHAVGERIDGAGMEERLVHPAVAQSHVPMVDQRAAPAGVFDLGPGADALDGEDLREADRDRRHEALECGNDLRAALFGEKIKRRDILGRFRAEPIAAEE